MSDATIRLPAEKRTLIRQLLARHGVIGPGGASIPKRASGALAPLSFGQSRLWFLDQLAPGNPFYNDCHVIRLLGSLDAAALRLSLGRIIARHEILRTVYPAAAGWPSQRVLEPPPLSLPVHELETLDPGQRASAIERLALADVLAPFDLQCGPLLRTTLLRLSANEHVLLLTLHHIVHDGWSVGVLLREFGAIYSAALAGHADALPPLRLQYADFAAWQHQHVEKVRAEQLSYWRQQLSGDRPALVMPADKPRPDVQSFRGAAHFFALPPSLSAAVDTFSRGGKVTPFVTLLAAYALLLHRYSGSVDFCVGTAVAGRTHTEIEDLIGFFVNTLVLRARVDPALSFRDLVGRLNTVVVEASAHQDLPFEHLVEELQPDRNLSYNPMFQLWFNLVDTPLPELALGDVTMSLMELDHRTARLELSLILRTTNEGYRGCFEYSTDLYFESTIAYMAGEYRAILDVAISQPDDHVAELVGALKRGAQRDQAESRRRRLKTARRQA